MRFTYNQEKNAELLKKRGIGFEEIITQIHGGHLIDVVEHHNQQQYPNQSIMQVLCLGKIYCVPYIHEQDGSIFLKTLYTSRKATKRYLIGNAP